MQNIKFTIDVWGIQSTTTRSLWWGCDLYNNGQFVRNLSYNSKLNSTDTSIRIVSNTTISDAEIAACSVKVTVLYSGSSTGPFNSFSFIYNLATDTLTSIVPNASDIRVAPVTYTNKYINVFDLVWVTYNTMSSNLNLVNGFDYADGVSYYSFVTINVSPIWYDTNLIPASNTYNIILPYIGDFGSLPPYPVDYKINSVTTNNLCKAGDITSISAIGNEFIGDISIIPNYIEHKGFVKDENGKAIKNVTLSFSKTPNNNTYATVLKDTNAVLFQTDSFGYFEFYDIQYNAIGYSAITSFNASHYNATTKSKVYTCYTTTDYGVVTLTRKKVTLSGTVKNAIGTGIAGATLTLTPNASVDNPADITIVVTDTTGHYTASVAEGDYTSLICSKSGVASQTYINLSTLNYTNLIVNFTGFNVLTDVKCNINDLYRSIPVTGANITFTSQSANGQILTLESNSYSGKLIPDIYTVSVSKAGYITKTFAADLRTNQVLYTFNIDLESDIVVLSGTVINIETGNILPNATINIVGGLINKTIYTNALGIYKYYIPTNTSYTITCSYSSLKPLTVITGILQRGFITQDFTLSAYGVGYLTGKVTNTSSAVLSGVSITPSNSVYNTNTLTGSDGIYNTTVKEGTYSIKAAKTNYIPTYVNNIYVASGLIASYNFNNFAKSVGDISGLVQDNIGHYLHGADIEYSSYKTKSVTGSYLIENITPINGIYITASYVGHYLASAGPVNIIANAVSAQNITLERYSAQIYGSVLDVNSGQPVKLCNISTNYDSTEYSVKSDGNYITDANLPMGTITVFATPTDKIHNSSFQIINIPGRSVGIPVNFALSRKNNCSIYGYIYTSINNINVKLSGVTITVIDTLDGTTFSAITTSNGYYNIGLYPSTWTISVSKNNFTVISEEFTITNVQKLKKDYTLVSSLLVANLSGYVKGLDLKRIKSRLEFGDSNTTYFTVTPSISGYYSITSIPPDIYKLKAYHAPNLVASKLYSDIETNLSFLSNENKIYNFNLPNLINFDDYRAWNYKNEVIGNGTLIGSYIDTLKFDGNIDTSSNVYDEITETSFYNSDNPNTSKFKYTPDSIDFDSSDDIDVISVLNTLQATYNYPFTKYINAIYGTDYLSDIYTPLSHPTVTNFDIVSTAHNALGLNKDIISYNPNASSIGIDYSSLPDFSYVGSININSHNFDISVVYDKAVASNLINDLYLKTAEFHQFYPSYTSTTIPSTMPLYASALPTMRNIIESSAFSNIAVASGSAYILGGKTNLQEQSINFYKLIPTQIGSKQYIAATYLGNIPGKARYGGISFTINNKVYYGLGAVATWLGVGYHLDQDKIPSLGYEFVPEEEHLYNYGTESICGVDETEFYTFSGYNNFQRYTGSWTDLTPTRSFPVSSYCHSKEAHIEFDPSHYVYNSLYESNTGNILITRFTRGYPQANLTVVATGNVSTNVKPMFTNSHANGFINIIPDWNIFVDDSYDATPTAPSYYCNFAFDYPVDGIRWRYSNSQAWQIIASYSPAVNAGSFILTPDENNIGKDSLVIRNYEIQGLSNIKNSLIASIGPIALDKRIPVASMLSMHKTGIATNIGKYFTEYINVKDYDTSVVELYAAGVASTNSASVVYQNIYTATIPYGIYSKNIFPGKATINYKFTPSFVSTGLNQVWVKAIDACGNAYATFTELNIDLGYTDTLVPSLVNWIKPTVLNALSANIPSKMNITVYDNTQLNDVQYRYSKDFGTYNDWDNVYFGTSDYKTGTFNLNTLDSSDGYYIYNLKVSDTNLNTSTYIGTYLIDRVYPNVHISNINGGLVPVSNGTTSPEYTKLLHFPIEVNYTDNYIMGTAWCNIDGILASRINASLTGTALYQKWQPVATLTPTLHTFTAYGQDLAGNTATSNYYIMCSPTRVFCPTGFVLHRNESYEL
jgi:hypothetical protein